MSEKRKKHASAPPAPAAAKHSGPMDLALLERLVKLMADNGLSALELSDGGQRIALKRGVDPSAIPQAQMMAYPSMPAHAGPTLAPSAANGGNGGPAPAGDEEAGLLKIKSPMVGTFYSAPAKGAKSYVNVGSQVDETTDVCIIEAMKNFNVHKAECSGVIARILVQDGQPVDFGQVLFLVKAS
ncbi:MAG TPA: acetyl-CoA carboxylase biotin carboxyl carrier protein [Tepidisphaeraceae bacterium]|nr:acetyl-CoA carboxylase biotin carboxyl carrier protein [Tepidisphaeraceae bacterium]